ncbi:radical SAM family heme chaperone HemW [Desulfatiferula olefinivorans]
MNGLYIHVPFCVQKCPYCDFYSVTDLSLRNDWVRAVTIEIQRVAAAECPEHRTVDTVYFGGGTPSVLSATHIGALLMAVSKAYHLTADVEITLEMNPGTVTADFLKDLMAIGVNRLSVGVQSFDDRSLSFLGRIHTAGEAEAILGAARDQGFWNVGLDIIHGLPGQTPQALEKDLDRALSFEPAHLSCYMLTYEDGTPLFKRLETGLITPLAEAPAARLFTIVMDRLGREGYLHYEISNHARTPDTRSRHNMKYWDALPYRGFGPSAHSYRPGEHKRSWNVRDIGSYLDRINRGLSAEESHEILSRDQEITEAVYLGLRKRSGIDPGAFRARFDAEFHALFGEAMAPVQAQGLLEVADGSVRLTRKGLLLADHITARLVRHLN